MTVNQTYNVNQAYAYLELAMEIYQIINLANYTMTV